MELSSEESAKIRAAVKAKLEELGSYVDEELPDYIMILVANNKTREQMSDDLSLFLRDHTSKFTEWLHGYIHRVRHPKESVSVPQPAPAAAKPTAIMAAPSVETASSSKTAGEVRSTGRRPAAAVVGGERGSDESDQRTRGHTVDPSRAAVAGHAITDDVVSSSRKQGKRKLPAAHDEPPSPLLSISGSSGGPRSSKVGRLEEASAVAVLSAAGQAAEQRQKLQGRSSIASTGAASAAASSLEELTVKVEQDDEFAAELDGDITGHSFLDTSDDVGSATSPITRQASRGARVTLSSLAAHVPKAAATSAPSSRSQCSPVGRNQPMATQQPSGTSSRSKPAMVDDSDGAERTVEARRGATSARPSSKESGRGTHSKTSPVPTNADVYARGDARRRQPATSSVVGNVVRRNDSESDDDYDPRRPVVGSVASVVKVTERRSSVPLSMQANSALLLKAVKAAHVSVAARPSRAAREGIAAAKGNGDSTQADQSVSTGVKRPSSSLQERLGKRSKIAADSSSAAAATAETRPSPPARRLLAPGVATAAADTAKPRSRAAKAVQLVAAVSGPADVDRSSPFASAVGDKPVHPASSGSIRAPRGASTPAVTRTVSRAAATAVDTPDGLVIDRVSRRVDEAEQQMPPGGTDLDLIVGSEELEELEAQTGDADAAHIEPTTAVRPKKTLGRTAGALQSLQGVVKRSASSASRIVQPRAKSPRFIVTLDGVSEEALTRHIDVRSLDEANDGRSRGVTRRGCFTRNDGDRESYADNDGDSDGAIAAVASSDLPRQLAARRLPAKMRLSARPAEAAETQIRRLPVSQRIAVRPPEPTAAGVPKQQLQRPSSAVMSSGTEDQTVEVPGSGSGGRTTDATQQPRERCRYWPSCKAGDACLYHHPSMPCRTFPDCKYGSQCHFIHPVCKFDALCTRDDCPYLHVAKRAVAAAAAAVPLPAAAAAAAAIAAATFGSGATGLPAAAFSKRGLLAAGLQHAARPSAPVGPPICKFYPRCTNMNCQFTHPKPCRYGVGCVHKATCPFSHPALPAKNQLRWSATSPSDDVAVLEALTS